MSSSGPFEVDKIVSLWTKLLELQVDIGYYPNDNSISFLPPEGRAVDETLCRDLRLTAEVISLLNRLPFPSNFDEAYDTTIFYESMAVPFTDDEWIRKSRDPERCFYADEDMSFRSDFLMPGELALVLAKDEPGYNLILDTRASKWQQISVFQGLCVSAVLRCSPTVPRHRPPFCGNDSALQLR
jgi:hypothetical protein